SWSRRWRRASAEGALRGLDLENLELEGAARGRHLDDLALLLAHDRLADRRLVRELLLGRVRLRGADDAVLDRLVRAHVPELHGRADRDDVLGDVLLLDHPRGEQPLLEHRDPVLEHRLLVLRDVAELARDADPIGHLAPLLGREVLDLLLELLVPFFGEDDFFGHLVLLLGEPPPYKERAARERRRGPEW